MERKDKIDLSGGAVLVAFAMMLAFNQVVIKVVSDGLQPVFFAGLRSMGAAVLVYGWIRFRGRGLDFRPGTLRPGLLIGVFFSIEFLCLFIALDLTTVTRTSVIFSSMPLWLALAAHFLIPGERMHLARMLGLICAFGGVVWAIVDRGAGGDGQASLLGDLLALFAAFGWAGIVLVVRVTPLAQLRPEMQHFWQLAVSTPILLGAAVLFGPLIRDLQVLHLWGLAFQIIVVVGAGFLFWFWLLTIYPASGVAAFSFLTPIFGIAFGWAMLGEEVGLSLLGAGGLVVIGIVLINRAERQPG